jgi:hypothetical protein
MAKEKSEKRDSISEEKKSGRTHKFHGLLNFPENKRLLRKEKLRKENRVFFKYPGALGVGQKLNKDILNDKEFMPWLNHNIGKYLLASDDGAMIAREIEFKISHIIRRYGKLSENAHRRVNEINEKFGRMNKREIDLVELMKMHPIGLIRSKTQKKKTVSADSMSQNNR